MKPAERRAVDRWYNRLLEAVVLPAGDAVLRTEFMAHLRRWRQIQHLPAGHLASLQATDLRDLLDHASSSVPYYRALRIEPADDPHEWLARFPILTKSVLRSEGERLVTPGASGLVQVSSSGSSGVQSTMWVTQREMSRTQAIQTLWWEWAGYRLGDRLLQTGMTPDRGVVKAVKDRVLRTTYVVAFGLDDDEMAEILARGADRPWRHLGGYASNLDAFAQAAQRAGLDDVGFESVISWGDKLFASYRQRLEQQFSAPVFDLYGTSEGVCVAAQRDGDDLYVMSPHVVVELLDDHDVPVAPGTMGRVVVTRLDAHTMPLVRFDLGDLAVAPAEPTQRPGQLAFPRLERVVGRDTDTIRTPGGRTLTVHTFTGVFEHFPEIEQFSIVPHAEGFVVEYRRGAGYTERVADAVTDRLLSVIGERVQVTWRAVEHIAPSPSGKPQIIRPPVEPSEGPGPS